jgi:hypothetical protein
MGCALALALAVALFAGADAPATSGPAAPPVEAAVPRSIVVVEKYALDAGFGAMRGEHELRFPAPDPVRIAALKAGGRLNIPGASVTGTTQLSVDEGEHHWLRTYHPDPRRDRGATLTLARTPVGIELSTSLYLEDQPFTGTDPRDANEPQSLRGACRFVFEQGVSFLVTSLDAAGSGVLRGSFHGQGEWNDARRCRGTVTAELDVR